MWVDRHNNRWTDRPKIDEQMYSQLTFGQADGKNDRYTDGIDRWTGRQKRQKDERTTGRRVNRWRDELTDGQREG